MARISLWVTGVAVVAVGCSSPTTGQDGGTPDSGAMVDSGSLDAGGPQDSGSGSNDAGGSDAGTADSGSVGVADSGTPDAGLLPDGGLRGFPNSALWASCYGTAAGIGDLQQAASTFRIFNIDADPSQGNFTPAQIQTLKGDGGVNKVISYMNVGACENFRSYWNTVPAGFVSCSGNSNAADGPYQGYPNEQWENLSDPDYQHLIVDYVAPLLMAQGVDGFFLDNLEIVEHGPNASDGPCDSTCAQGGLDLVYKLRQKFPGALIVMQNATSDVTRLGVTNGVPYPTLLDGISHESVYAPSYDQTAESQLLAWKSMNLRPGYPFWIATEDYVGSSKNDCSNTQGAQQAYQQSRANGFSPYATDGSQWQQVICYWGL